MRKTAFLSWMLLLGFSGADGESMLAAAELTQAQQEGQALAAELRAQQPAEDFTSSGVLRVRDGQGRRREVRVKLQVQAGEPAWKSIHEAMDTNQVVLERLVVVHADQRPNEYQWARIASANQLGASETLAGGQAMIAFAGTDFWLADLGLEFFHWQEQRLVKKEMRKGRSCRVLESINPNPVPGNYARVLSWIDVETSGLVRAEAYGPDHRLLKEFSIRGLTRVKGRWELKEMEIRNAQTDSRTRLEFQRD